MIDIKFERKNLEYELLNYLYYKELLNSKKLHPLVYDRLWHIVCAAEHTYKMLNVDEAQVFDALYKRFKKDIYSVCNDVCISTQTFRRYRSKIIALFGKQMGHFECAPATD